MKTTLMIPDLLMAQVKREAGRQGMTLSALVEAALHAFLKGQKHTKKELRPLPQYAGGPFLVDIADRIALIEKLGGRW